MGVDGELPQIEGASMRRNEWAMVRKGMYLMRGRGERARGIFTQTGEKLLTEMADLTVGTDINEDHDSDQKAYSKETWDRKGKVQMRPIKT